MRTTGLGSAALAAYASTIVAANWAIGHLGACPADGQGPCVVPVWPGIAAPSGVLFVGAALFLRDAVQDTLGRRWTIAGILAGAALSYLVESPALALASGVAFLLSEGADFAVYTPLRERRYHWQGVLASGVVGGLVDSALFLWIAGFGTAFLLAQWIGKTEITLLAAVIVWAAGAVGAIRRERAVA